ncbi:MAG: hypothetical protein ACI849_000537 [Patiriisocius sp.]|jgi:uncharacterized protein YggE
MNYLKTVVFLLTTTLAMAQHTSIPSVDVTGEGTINIVPDQVSIKVRVENTGENPQDVKQKNDAVISQVFATINKFKIEDKDVQTDYIRLSKNFEYNTKTYKYAANQAITIRLRALDKYEALMNSLLESGINRIDGLTFMSSNQAELEVKARQRAVQNAKDKATQYATVLSQSIGKAIHISEFQQASGPQPMYRAMAMDSEMASGKQTIAPGELELKVRVSIKFELL